MKQSERVRALMEGFMDDRKAGHPLSAIAHKYGVSVCHVYYLLEKIAAQEGTTREALLYQPHSQFSRTATLTSRKQQSAVNPDEVRKDFNDLFGKIDQILDKMNRVMMEEE